MSFQSGGAVALLISAVILSLSAAIRAFRKPRVSERVRVLSTAATGIFAGAWPGCPVAAISPDRAWTVTS